MVKGTAKAILMEINGEQIWIAKSHIECMPGFKAIFPVSDWLAWQKNLISQAEFDKRKSEYKSNKPAPEQTSSSQGQQGNIPF